MNRIAQLIVALSVLFCVLSCNEKINAEFSNRFDYITVTTQVGPHVKAGYEGTSSLPKDFYIDITQGSNVIYQGKVVRTDDSNRYYFVGAPEDWESSDISNVYVKAITGNGPQNNNSSLAVNVQTDQAKDDGSGVMSSDFLGATTGNGIVINDNNINVTFSHLMSKLVVKYTGSLTVNSMTLKNVCVNGTYDFGKMKYNYPNSPSLGNISMYHNQSAKTYEAIFCPHLPIENQTNANNNLHLSINLGSTTLTCPIELKNSDGFIGGKCYTVSVAISGSSAQNAGVSIEEWDGDSNTEVAGERVLWIGTSIPSGAPEYGYISYPEYVDAGMNCTVVNNAVRSSYVVAQNISAHIGTSDWLNPAHYLWYTDENGEFEKTIHDNGARLCLSLTHKDYEDVYLAKLREISSYKALLEGTLQGDPSTKGEPDEEWVSKVLGHFQKYSYESLIIPYIDGTKDNCTTVILDHGFNDRGSMYLESGAYNLSDNMEQSVAGYNYLMQLARGQADLDDFKEKIAAGNKLDANITLENSYIYSMSKIIQAIKKDYPWVRIIIGNYFTTNNPYCRQVDVAYSTNRVDYDRLPRLICYNNEALAGLWDLEIVNVQSYLWIGDNEYWAGWDSANNKPIEDWTKFCPDGVHPFNPESVQAIADIYIRELDGVIGSRIK